MRADLEKTQAPAGGEMLEREYNRIDRGIDPRYADTLAAAPSRPMSESERLNEIFSYHAPTPSQIPKYNSINQAAKNFAEIILQNCAPSADRSDAIRKIREARMVANASIALDGLSL